jgi:cytochrome c551
VTCHNFGAGGGAIGPDLSHGAPRPSKADIQAQIENGGGGMPAFKDAFTPEEIQQIVDFIDGLRTGTPPSS